MLDGYFLQDLVQTLEAQAREHAFVHRAVVALARTTNKQDAITSETLCTIYVSLNNKISASSTQQSRYANPDCDIRVFTASQCMNTSARSLRSRRRANINGIAAQLRGRIGLQHQANAI
jgi:hypothetical protein